MLQEKFISRYCDAIECDLDNKLKNFHAKSPLKNIPLKTLVESRVISMLLNWDDTKTLIIDNKKIYQIKNRRSYYIKNLHADFLKEYNLYKETGKRGKTLKKIEPDDIENIAEKVIKWKEDISTVISSFDRNICSYLIDFPLITEFSDKKIERIFECDMEYNIYRLSGNKTYSNFVQVSPFTPGVYTGDRIRITAPFSTSYDEEIKVANEYGLTTPLPSIDKREELKAFYAPGKDSFSGIDFTPFKLDEKCKKLISYFTFEMLRKLAENIELNKDDSLSVKGKITEICALLDDRKSSKGYNSEDHNRAIKYLLNVANFRLVSGNGDSYTNMAFVDKLNLSSTGEKEKYDLYEVKIGNAIIESILNNTTEYVITSQLEMLDSALARLLYGTIRGHRLADLSRNKAVREYDVISLMMIASTSGSKGEKFKKYKAALTEIQEQGFLIEKIEHKNYTFYIKWLPLTDAERKDIYEDLADGGRRITDMIEISKA